MSHQPLVSIIIPTYNRAHLIGETLDSVLAQTYQNWECIIVDDGSSDNTDDVVGAYVKKDSRFKYYHRPDEHLPGGNGARNYGFTRSNGEYVNWLDSDDVFLNIKLEKQLKPFNTKSEVDATISRSYIYNFKKREIYFTWRKKLFSKNLLIDFLNLKVGWCISDPLWKKSSLRNLSFNEKLKSYQDWEFHVKLIVNKFNFVFIEEGHVYIRQTPKSIKNNVNLNYYKSMYFAHESVFKELKLNCKLSEEILFYFLKKYYNLLAKFFRHKQIGLSFRLFYDILYLSMKTKTLYSFFYNFFIAFPVKILK